MTCMYMRSKSQVYIEVNLTRRGNMERFRVLGEVIEYAKNEKAWIEGGLRKNMPFCTFPIFKSYNYN